MAKAFGRDIQDFYENHWPEEYYHEDSAVEFNDDNGKWQLKADTEYNLEDCGYLEPQHRGKGLESIPFEEAFTDWLNARGFDTITIKFPKAQKDRVTAQIISMGAKII